MNCMDRSDFNNSVPFSLPKFWNKLNETEVTSNRTQCIRASVVLIPLWWMACLWFDFNVSSLILVVILAQAGNRLLVYKLVLHMWISYWALFSCLHPCITEPISSKGNSCNKRPCQRQLLSLVTRGSFRLNLFGNTRMSTLKQCPVFTYEVTNGVTKVK